MNNRLPIVVSTQREIMADNEITQKIIDTLNGVAHEFGKNFILINWQAGKQWDNKVCRSLNEAENWFRSDEWSINTEEEVF